MTTNDHMNRLLRGLPPLEADPTDDPPDPAEPTPFDFNAVLRRRSTSPTTVQPDPPAAA